jgi:hypothetical protein
MFHSLFLFLLFVIYNLVGESLSVGAVRAGVRRGGSAALHIGSGINKKQYLSP